MFSAYWLFMIISLLTSIVYIVHAYKEKNNILILTSIIQGILAISLPFINLVYIPNEQWLSSFENEFVFLWSQLLSGNTSAILVFLSYLFMIFLVLWNGRWITKRIHKHSIIF